MDKRSKNKEPMLGVFACEEVKSDSAVRGGYCNPFQEDETQPFSDSEGNRFKVYDVR